MSVNAFIGKAEAPSDADLAEVLGPALPVWRDLVSAIGEACGITGQEWTSYSRKVGWSLRLQVKKRNIVYLSPYLGSFGVAFVLGAKALEEAKNLPKSPKVLREALEAGKKYAEGTGVQLQLSAASSEALLSAVARLAVIKRNS